MHEDDFEVKSMSQDGTEPEAPRKGFTAFAEAVGARNLIIVIITMPLAFIAVLTASLLMFGKPGGEVEGETSVVRSTPAGDTLAQPPLAESDGVVPPTAVSAGGPAPLVIPSGEDITAMAVDGDRLVLRVKGDGGGAIVVYDLAQGTEVQRIRVLENPVDDDL